MGRPDRGSGRVLERRASRCATAHERGERESSEPRAQGPVRQAKLRVLPSSRDRSIEKPLAPSVGLNLVRADLERVRDKAGGRSRSGAQIARNEASEGHKAEARAPSGLLPPAPDGDEVSVGTRPRACSDQVIARDFLGKAGPPSQLKSLRR